MVTVKVTFRPSYATGNTDTRFCRVAGTNLTGAFGSDSYPRFEAVHTSNDYTVEERAEPLSNHPKLEKYVTIYRQEVINHYSHVKQAARVPKNANSPKKVKRVYLLDYIQTQIRKMLRANRLGTARNYQKAWNSLRTFLGDRKLLICDIDESLVSDYNTYLTERGLVRNSISFYMRIFRAVYNRAVRQRLAVQSYPFNTVYTGVDKTRKRAIDEMIIEELNRKHFSVFSPFYLVRDLFIFSYCTRGMAFVDMAYLRKSNLQNDTICYTRRKTGQQLTVRIEPTIRRIIDRYANDQSPYIFPLLTTEEPLRAYEEYLSALNSYNRRLRLLAKHLSIKCKITSYTSRHSWATAARNHNVPLSVISAGMGHTSEQTTRIYLALLDNSIIDDANRGIIGRLR